MALQFTIVSASEGDRDQISKSLNDFFSDEVNVVQDWVPFLSTDNGINDFITGTHIYANHSLLTSSDSVQLVISTASIIEQVAALTLCIKKMTHSEDRVKLTHQLIVLEGLLREDIKRWDTVYYKPVDPTTEFDDEIIKIFVELSSNSAKGKKNFVVLPKDTDKAADIIMETIEDWFGLNRGE